MSANLVPQTGSSAATPRQDGSYAPQSWGQSAAPSESSIGEQVQRSVSALRRYKWLIALIVLVGSGIGFVLTQFVQPKYEVRGTLWLTKDQGNRGGGPVQAPGLLTDDMSWQDLVRSYKVLDNVVQRLRLFVVPARLSDSTLFAGFETGDSLLAGKYLLNVNGARYTLTRLASGRGQEDRVIEQGAVGDSIGRRAGFSWHPEAALLRSRNEIEFSVSTPREAAARLGDNLSIQIPLGSNFMRLIIVAARPDLAALTLNTLMDEFLDVAGELKKQKLTAIYNSIEEQRQYAEDQLANAEISLEGFKVRSITEPTEGVAVTPGVGVTMNPVIGSYFSDRVLLEGTRRDREALEQVIKEGQARGGRLSVEALRALPLIVGSNPNLATSIVELYAAQKQLDGLRQTYTDSHPGVQRTQLQVERLERQAIPQFAAASLEELRLREADMGRRVAGASRALQQIPANTIEEMRRNRDVQVASQMYLDLQNRAVQAKLEEASALPDVSILDDAVAPSVPSSDTTLGILLVAIGGSIGLALAMALLLDRMDKRFRYPEQATGELGLDILGAIPTIRRGKNSIATLEEASQLVEAFRSLSLTIRNAFEPGAPVLLTVSSPGPGDGKSLLSSNLALAFADAGFRTALVDGDIRRGALHSLFGQTQRPGLLDYLAGESPLGEIVRDTTHRNMCLVPCGSRRRQGPELLAGEGMSRLIRELATQFDAVIVDSAPLAAGIDAYALSAATGALVMVLRTGETDRKLAQAKLTVLDRMPVRLLGAVLNDIGSSPTFQYYSYLDGYGTLSEAEEQATLAPAGGPDKGR